MPDLREDDKMSKRASKWKKKTKPYKAPKTEDLEAITGRWKVHTVPNTLLGSLSDLFSFPDKGGLGMKLALY